MSEAPNQSQGHLLGEATPQEIAAKEHLSFGFHDSEWSQHEWLQLLTRLIESGICTWKDVTALVLGHLNPSQVGTSLASSAGFKRRYGKGNTMKIVREWFYRQTGLCTDCRSRLELQADHIKGREEYQDPLDADFIENMTLRCRRCNVVRRPSHELGGLRFLTTEAALMWVLLVLRPRTYEDYRRMCRIYGMTMADIRMQEAWAMAHWLAKADSSPTFGIEDNENSFYDLLLWPDSAITRIDPDSSVEETSIKIHTKVSGKARLGFLSTQADGRLKFHEHPLRFIPFSTYDLGKRSPQSLCVNYSHPDRKKALPPKLLPLAPREAILISHAIALPDQAFYLTTDEGIQTKIAVSTKGKVIPTTTHEHSRYKLHVY